MFWLHVLVAWLKKVTGNPKLDFHHPNSITQETFIIINNGNNNNNKASYYSCRPLTSLLCCIHQHDCLGPSIRAEGTNLLLHSYTPGWRPAASWRLTKSQLLLKKISKISSAWPLHNIKTISDIVVKYHTASIIMLYLWENIRSHHTPPPLTGHPVWRPQGQRSFTDIWRDGTDHSSLHGPCISTREGLVEAHHRWAGSRHNLVVSIIIWDRRLGGGQDGVGQVWSARAGVRLLPAQLPSIIHRMLPKMQQKSGIKLKETLRGSQLENYMKKLI